MTTAMTQPPVHAAGPAHVAAPAFGRLYVVELRRFFARRFMRAALLLSLVGYLVLIGGLWRQHAKVTPADLAQATRQRDQIIQDITRSRAECVKAAPVGEADFQCGTVPSAADFPVDQFLTVHPFTPTLVSDVALTLGVGVAALGFVLGATFIGAEWSSRNIVAWLFWEPRRLRLLGAKALALLSVMLAVSASTQLSWAVIGRFMLRKRGVPVSTLGPAARNYWSDLAALQVRAGLVVIAMALIAFGVAHLLRNSAAAFGFGFLYFAVIENAVRILRPALGPYVLSDGIAAWVQRHGIDIFLPDRLDRRTGEFTQHVVHLSNARGGITLLVYVAVVAVLAVAGFRRRDIT